MYHSEILSLISGSLALHICMYVWHGNIIAVSRRTRLPGASKSDTDRHPSYRRFEYKMGLIDETFR